MSNLFGPLLAERGEATTGPVSLCFSLKTWGTFVLGGIATLVVLGYLRSWWIAGIGLGVMAVFVVVFGERRIDLDDNGLTFVPLVPLRRPQRVAWSELGPFGEKLISSRARSRTPSRFARAQLESGRSHGIFRRNHIDVPDSYGLGSYSAPALPFEELLAMLERYRTAAISGRRGSAGA